MDGAGGLVAVPLLLLPPPLPAAVAEGGIDDAASIVLALSINDVSSMRIED